MNIDSPVGISARKPSRDSLSYPLPDVQIDLSPDGSGDCDDIRTQIWGLLTALYPKSEMLERRRETRYPFPYLVHLTPVENDGKTPSGDNMVVVGKHVSQRGLGFYHPQPLPWRRAIASMENGRHSWFGFLIDLHWCRFTRQGWYESGGRFLEAVTSPLEKR
jgi:hypothetical protein